MSQDKISETYESSMSKIDKRYYILVGSEQNWKVSLEHNLWGFTENSKGSWNTTKSGDLLAFYVTRPVKKVIGFGKVGKKFSNDNLVWDDEKLFNRSIWKYKFEIIPEYVCKNWEKGIELPPMALIVSRRVIDKDVFGGLLKKADTAWKTKLFSEFFGKK